MEHTKKEIIQLFKSNNLSITIDTNMQQVNFLDITLNLKSCKYSPYRKPNDQLLYIHKDSNHPPTIKRQLPTMFQQRISDLSIGESEFNTAKGEYQSALESSGFHDKLIYAPSTPKSRSRSRSVIWFNPHSTPQ